MAVTQKAAVHEFMISFMLLLVVSPLAAQAQKGRRGFLGGPKGVVRSSTGQTLEGIMVQLISRKSAIRTTVYSDEDGRYEFPKLEPGEYTLRIARPMEFRPYVKERVRISGADQLENIILTRFMDPEPLTLEETAAQLSASMPSPVSRAMLPPLEEIAAQLTGSEWLLNLPGTGEQKKLLTENCNWCHSYQQIFRNRYDEQGWSKIVNRMVHWGGSPLIHPSEPGRMLREDETKLVKWLATVRGPESKDAPFVTLPRPSGRATRAIITEYELPRLELATHDIAGDSKGNIWYTPHRSSYIGRLDPRTGAVKEYHVPLPTDGALPGEHWIYVDRNDIVWMSETWLVRLTGSIPARRNSAESPGCPMTMDQAVLIMRSMRKASSGTAAPALFERLTRLRASS